MHAYTLRANKTLHTTQGVLACDQCCVEYDKQLTIKTMMSLSKLVSVFPVDLPEQLLQEKMER